MERIAMSERAEALAAQFEAVRDQFLAFARDLTPQQWTREVPEENRTIAAMVHHIAWSYEVETAAFRAMAEGRPFQAWTDETLAQVNQINAQIFRDADYQETLRYLQLSGEEAASFIRSLSDTQLDRRGAFMEGDPEGGTVAEWIEWVLVGHVEGHFPAIRAVATGPA